MVFFLWFGFGLWFGRVWRVLALVLGLAAVWAYVLACAESSWAGLGQYISSAGVEAAVGRSCCHSVVAAGAAAAAAAAAATAAQAAAAQAVAAAAAAVAVAAAAAVPAAAAASSSGRGSPAR